MAIEMSITRRDEHGHLHPAKLVLDGDEAERYERDWASPDQTSGMYTGTVDGIAATELVTFDVKVTFPVSSSKSPSTLELFGLLMNQSEQKIKDIIDKLYEQISSGWRAFQIAKLIRQAQRGQRIKSGFGFFEGAYASCLESAFLALARLIVRDVRGKPLNIWYLLNCLQTDPDVLTGAPRQAILLSIKEHNAQLEAIESTISNVEEQRHTTVAHLDKRHVNNPAAIYNYPPLSQSDIEDAYRLLLKIIDTYTGYFQPSDDRSHLFQTWNNTIEGDIEYIVGLIEQDNQRPVVG